MTPSSIPALLRRGYTILEVSIASFILFMLVAALLSAWSATTDFTYMVNENLKRMEAIERIRSTMSSDFSNSAQFVQYDTTVMVASVNPVTNENITLYPAILQGGREVRFTRLRSSLTANVNPDNESLYRENLIGTNAQPLSQYALAPVSPSFVINPSAGLPGYWNLAPVWESNRTGLTFVENATPANLRLYRYILVPYSSVPTVTLADGVTFAPISYPLYVEAGRNLRRGVLLRQYRNANATVWQTLGMPLSDAVVFDTANDEDDATRPCFVFSSAFDGITRSGTEVVNDNEVRLRMSLAMAIQQTGTPVVLDLRLALPFRRVDFGD
jgi:type II secretory pathway pseudopilin PulG